MINEQILGGIQILNPNIDLKKNKYDNINDLLLLSYDKRTIETEYNKVFQKTLQLNKDFYKSWDAILEVP